MIDYRSPEKTGFVITVHCHNCDKEVDEFVGIWPFVDQFCSDEDNSVFFCLGCARLVGEKSTNCESPSEEETA